MLIRSLISVRKSTNNLGNKLGDDSGQFHGGPVDTFKVNAQKTTFLRELDMNSLSTLQ